MPDAELITPDNVAIDDVEGSDPTYKRLVALLVVLITLFGSVVAYLQAVESNTEDVAARDAQRDAIAGLGAQVDASAELASDLRISSELDAQLQRQALNAGRVQNFGGDVDSDIHVAAVERYAAVREAIAGLTPIDPTDQSTIDVDFAEANENPDAARLRQAVEADRANDHGSKADAYVAVLTVLAVSLFLLGLSLTVQGRSRVVLAAPGIAIAIVCVAWTGLIASRGVTKVSDGAIRAAAEGLRLQDAGDLEGAIEAFDAAIEESPDFAAAFARRASARFLQGSGQIGQTGFISITSEEALEDALEDTERALELGAGSDVVTVADAAFTFYLDGDFARSAELSREAIELNDQLAQIWFNLGVAEVAQGNEREAARAYREGRRLLEDAPDAGTRTNVLAGARTDLSVLREILDEDELDDVIEQVEAIEGELAAFEAGFAEPPCATEPCPTAEDANDPSIGDAEFRRSGSFVFATYPVEGAEPGTPVTSVWYVRTDDELPFEQAAFGLESVRVADDGTVTTATLPSFNPPCPVAGDYLVRSYVGEQLIGETAGTIEPSILGTSFTSLDDPIEGVEVCVPEGFAIDRADVSELDTFIGMLGEDVDISLNVAPGSVAEGIDPDQLARAVVSQSLGIDESELIDVVFQGRDLSGDAVSIPGVAGVTEDQGGIITAIANGPDGAARTINIFRTTDLAVLDEVMGLVQFTNVQEL